MKPLRPSNYDIMRDRMELEFAKYDQMEMIRKFSLRYDKDFLYLRFVGRNYRINRTNGRTEWYSDAEKNFIHAGYNESMTIFDVLAWSKPSCHLAGRFVPAGDLPGTTKSASAAGNLFSRQSGIFAGRCEALREACKPKCSLTPWFDEQCIRWDKKSIFGLRHAAFQAGLGIIRKNNFFYDEKGSWLELEGFVIDRECQLYQNQQFRIHIIYIILS